MAAVGVLERDSLAADSRVDVEPSAEPMLTTRSRHLVSQLVHLITAEADSRQIPWTGIHVSGFVHWDEGDRKLFVCQQVLLPAVEACAYWDSLQDPIDSWMSGLSQHDVELIHRSISVQVDW